MDEAGGGAGVADVGPDRGRMGAPAGDTDGTTLTEELARVRAAYEAEREVTRRLRGLDEQKNAFLAAVSHELRTPLTAVLGFAQTLQRAEVASPELRAHMIDKVVTNAAKLEHLLADLLDVSRLAEGVIEPHRTSTDLVQLIQDVVADCDGLASRDVRLHLEPVVAEVDAGQIERVVENLLVNVCRHTNEGTSVWITLGADDGFAHLVVEDAGPGIASDRRERVFGAFEHFEGQGGLGGSGSGIGLNLVARFARLHGGDAWVGERPGGGAAVHVRLPLHVEDLDCLTA